MRFLASELFSEKAADVDHLPREPVSREQFFHSSHAQSVPMIFIHRAHDMVGNFIELKKSGANSAVGDAANLFHRGFHSFQRQMLEQIVEIA
jgi:hypothetical protein